MDEGFPGGGSLALARLIEEHGGSVYADLRRYYGVDLSGVVADPPTISPAEVLALVENLPAESMTVSLEQGIPEAVGWGLSEHLLASVVDAVRENTFANMQVRTKKKLKAPDRIPVPGRKVEKKPNKFLAMARAQFAKGRSE